MTPFEFLDKFDSSAKRFEVINRLSISFKLRFAEASDIYEAWLDLKEFI